MSEPKPILYIKLRERSTQYDLAFAKESLMNSPIAKDYHVLVISGETDHTHVEILSIKEMDIEKQNQILDAVDKLMSKH